MELDYRDRMARMRRLRELAANRGDVERVNEIDRLREAVQARHAERVHAVLEGGLGPEERASLDEELCSGRDPRELAEFRRKMKERAAAHREAMAEERKEFRHEAMKENAEHRESMKEARRDFRGKMHEQKTEHRESMKEDRREFREQAAERRAGTKERRGEARDAARDRRDAEREAARALHEEEWDRARDRALAETPGAKREEAVKRIVAERMKEDARHGREADWRRAAARDGSLRDDLGPFRRSEARKGFRMPTQKEADDLAVLEIADGDADAEFERLREEAEAP
jgi:hypothetical protein